MFCSSVQQTQARSAIVDLGSLPLAAFFLFSLAKFYTPKCNFKYQNMQNEVILEVFNHQK
jgi:hypothetical protein